MASPGGSYRDLVVWQKAMDLVDAVYDLTDQFPKEEVYGLIAQMKKAAISMPSNIAEGRRRGTDADFRHFLIIAFGSGAELETQVEIAKRRQFSKKLDFSKVDILLDEIMRILNKMINK